MITTYNTKWTDIPIVIMAEQKVASPMVDWAYDLFLWILSILVDLFFREIHPRGSWRIPRRGPIIFVAAPHANQVRITTAIRPARLTNLLTVRRSAYPYACR